MGKKWKNGEFGINDKDVNVYHLMAEHFPKMFPRLTKLHKTFLFGDERMPQRPAQHTNIAETFDRSHNLWDLFDSIIGAGGFNIKVNPEKQRINCKCNAYNEWDCGCPLYAKTDNLQFTYTIPRESWVKEEAEWQRLHREREEQQAINKVNIPFNKEAVERNRKLIGMAKNNLVYWIAANKAIHLGDESELKNILANDLREQLKRLEGETNEQVTEAPSE